MCQYSEKEQWQCGCVNPVGADIICPKAVLKATENPGKPEETQCPNEEPQDLRQRDDICVNCKKELRACPTLGALSSYLGPEKSKNIVEWLFVKYQVIIQQDIKFNLADCEPTSQRPGKL